MTEREQLARKLEDMLAPDTIYTYKQASAWLAANGSAILAALREPAEPTQEEVERVARAIHAACQPYVALGPDAVVPRWSDLQTGIWQDIARAAIAAMRGEGK